MKDVTILIKFKALQHLQTRITELHNFNNTLSDIVTVA